MVSYTNVSASTPDSHAPVAQLAELQTFNLMVVGSSPTGRTVPICIADWDSTRVDTYYQFWSGKFLESCTLENKMQTVYVLLKELIGGEEEDRNSSEIVAVMSDVTELVDHFAIADFVFVDPEFFDELSWDYPNPVSRYVIRGFYLETGKEVEDWSMIFWSAEDLAANGCDVST